MKLSTTAAPMSHVPAAIQQFGRVGLMEQTNELEQVTDPHWGPAQLHVLQFRLQPSLIYSLTCNTTLNFSLQKALLPKM